MLLSSACIAFLSRTGAALYIAHIKPAFCAAAICLALSAGVTLSIAWQRRVCGAQACGVTAHFRGGRSLLNVISGWPPRIAQPHHGCLFLHLLSINSRGVACFSQPMAGKSGGAVDGRTESLNPCACIDLSRMVPALRRRWRRKRRRDARRLAISKIVSRRVALTAACAA